MASLIRLPGETDAEYQRRAAPLAALMVDVLRRNSRLMADTRLEDTPLMKAMRLNELRLSCGVEPAGEPFRWDIVHQVSP